MNKIPKSSLMPLAAAPRRLRVSGFIVSVLFMGVFLTQQEKIQQNREKQKSLSVAKLSGPVQNASALNLNGKIDHAPTQTSKHRSGVRGGIALQSTGQNYTYVFSGHVDCASSCKDRSIRVSLLTTTDTQVEQSVRLKSDGSYSVPLTIHETMGEQLDWRLTVEHNNDTEKELSGRSILMDYETIKISHQIQIG